VKWLTTVARQCARNVAPAYPLHWMIEVASTERTARAPSKSQSPDATRPSARWLSPTAMRTALANESDVFTTPNSWALCLKVTSRAGTGVTGVTDQC